MTLSISATKKKEKKPGQKHRRKIVNNYLIFYLAFTSFVALTGAVYERFSHGVYSYFMIYAFAVPLLLGLFPSVILSINERIRLPGYLCMSLYNHFVVTLTVLSLVKGVLDIYGTSNKLIFVYVAMSAALLIASAVLFVVERVKKRKVRN